MKRWVPRNTHGVIALSQLPLSRLVVGEDGEKSIQICDWRTFPLYQHLLTADAEGYANYSRAVDEYATRPNSMVWQEFLALREEINTLGYVNNLDNPIVVTSYLGQLDGAHRIAILLATRGPSSECVVVDGQVFIPLRRSRSRVTSQDVKELEFVVRLTRFESARAEISPSEFMFRAVRHWAPSLGEKFLFSN